jgi:hypothetical protein
MFVNRKDLVTNAIIIIARSIHKVNRGNGKI